MNRFGKTAKKPNHFMYTYLPKIATALVLSLGLFSAGNANAQDKSQQAEFLSLPASNYVSLNVKSVTKQKVRIAVLDFDYSSIADYDSWYWWIRGDGKGVSEILVNKLVDSGNFIVVERSKLDAILQEQNLGASGRVDTATAAQIGRLLGVDVVVLGSVTSFNIEKDNGGVCAFGICAGGNKTSANTKLNVRLVNTTTGEILSVAEGNGKSGRGDGNLSFRGFSVNSNSRKEAKLLAQAMADAIDQVNKKINNDSAKLAATPKSLPNVEALVADISGKNVILNKGSADGFRQGMKLSIQRVTREVKDPSTGKVIRKITQQVGLIEITEVDASSSVGKIISGATFKVGDVAKATE